MSKKEFLSISIDHYEEMGQYLSTKLFLSLNNRKKTNYLSYLHWWKYIIKGVNWGRYFPIPHFFSCKCT